MKGPETNQHTTSASKADADGDDSAPTRAGGSLYKGSDAGGFAGRVRHALAWRYGSQIMAQIITWGSTLMVVRLLEPSDYGLFAMSQVVLAALAFMNGWGFANSLVQEAEIDRRKIGQVFALLLLLNGTLAVVQFLIAPLAAAYYGEPIVADMLRVQAVLFLTTPFIALPSALLSREIAFRSQGVANMAGAVTGAVSALTLAWFDFGVWALVYAPLLAFSARALVLTVSSRLLVWPVFDFRGAGAMVSYGGAMTVVQLLWIIQSQSDIFIAGRVFEPYALGLYSEALFLTLIVTGRFLPPLNEVAFPAYAEMHKQGRPLGPYFIRTLRAVALITAPIYIGLALTAPEAIGTIFGDKWLPMAPIVAGLSLVMPAMALQIVCAPATNATGHARISVYTSLIGAVLFPLCFLVGITNGPFGMVHAWWIAAPVLLIATLVLTLPIVQVGAVEFLRAILPAAVGCLAMACAVFALRMVLPDWPAPLRLLALAITGALTYAAVMWFGWRALVDESLNLIRRRPLSVPEPGDRIQTTAG